MYCCRLKNVTDFEVGVVGSLLYAVCVSWVDFMYALMVFRIRWKILNFFRIACQLCKSKGKVIHAST